MNRELRIQFRKIYILFDLCSLSKTLAQKLNIVDEINAEMDITIIKMRKLLIIQEKENIT